MKSVIKMSQKNKLLNGNERQFVQIGSQSSFHSKSEVNTSPSVEYQTVSYNSSPAGNLLGLYVAGSILGIF